MTYDDAQKIVDGNDCGHGEEINNDVRMLHNIASYLRTSRYTKDAMSLSRQHLVFDEPNQPTTITIADPKPDIVKIVKEFLFMANRCVAQKISSQYPEQALLRRQAPPNTRKIVNVYFIMLTKKGFTNYYYF